jgi:hypothetical protein
MQWSNAKLTSVEVLSKQGQPCRIKAGTNLTVLSAGQVITPRIMLDGSVEFPTMAGVRYQISSE